MVRHYESLGLLPAVDRIDAGYRRYPAHCCHGDHRPDCPIFDELEGQPDISATSH